MVDPADTPECHREWWDMCCSDRKFVALAAPRGHAKSTAITFAYTLAAILFRERKYVVIISDTEAQSSLFLGNIKTELANNEDLRILFGVKEYQSETKKFDKETETDLIIEFVDGHKSRILAKGAGQKLRGLNWLGQRPDLIIGDDMENDEMVMNKERRDKFKRWFIGAVVPCLSKYGVIRIIGTILHMDSLLENYMPKAWKKDTREGHLSIKSNPNTVWLSAKYRAHTSMNDFTDVLWPDSKPAKWLREEQKLYLVDGEGDLWAQEFLNDPIDDSNALFRKTDFVTLRDEDRKQNLNLYVSFDLAVTKDDVKRDYSVFTMFGVDEDGRAQVINIHRERMDTLEIVDHIIAIQKQYEPVFFIGEKGTIDRAIRPFLIVKSIEENVYPSLYSVAVNNTDKIIRSSPIRGRMRAGMVKFDKEADWYPALEQECIQFPRSKHDDQVDTLSLMGIALTKYVQAHTMKEMEQQQYEEEKAEHSDSGRSSFTGY